MLHIVKFFENLFDDAKITVNRLIDFAKDNIGKMTSNNTGGIYTSRITATQTKVDALQTVLDNKNTDGSNYAGSTVSKTQSRAYFQNYLSQQEGLIKSVFGKGSQQYTEFFPKGLSGFQQATDTNFDSMAKTVVQKATEYVAELGTPFKTQITALYTAYDTAFDTQDSNKINVEGVSEAETIASLALQLQLTDNVLFTANSNINNPTAADIYFNTALLFAPHRVHRFKGEVGANQSIKICDFDYSPGKHFKLKNTGPVPLGFQFHSMNMPVGNAFTIQSGTSISVIFSDFFSVGDMLYVTNPSNNADGAYLVSEIA